ncbi:MAG: hypothetical protein ACAH11_13810 [Sphingomonas sp.]
MISGIAVVPAASATPNEAETYAAGSCDGTQWAQRGYATYQDCYDAHLAYWYNVGAGGPGGYVGGGGSGGGGGGSGGDFIGGLGGDTNPNNCNTAKTRLCNDGGGGDNGGNDGPQ